MNDFRFKAALPNGAMLFFSDLNQAADCIKVQEKVFRKKLLIEKV